MKYNERKENAIISCLVEEQSQHNELLVCMAPRPGLRDERGGVGVPAEENQGL